VQHPTGGVIGELRLRDGSQVKAGDLLLRLDETVHRANLAMINIEVLIARQARLTAEQDGSEGVTFGARSAIAAADSRYDRDPSNS
jgi:membrane fusion protein, type I secretion system